MPILAATRNQQLMFSSESWAGECGGSWRAGHSPLGFTGADRHRGGPDFRRRRALRGGGCGRRAIARRRAGSARGVPRQLYLPAHCLKSNVTEPGLYKVSWRIQARNGRYLASAVRKISRNASANPIWASILPVPSSLLIPALVHTIFIT